MLKVFTIVISSLICIAIIGPLKQWLQPILLVSTLIDLGLFTKIASTKNNQSLQGLFELGILLISTILIETLILSSGGIYGPFFILTYLFALGLGLFVGLLCSITFLAGMVGLIIWQILNNPQIGEMFKTDPWLGVLYGSSMFVVVPLLHYLTKTYHLKDNLAKKLTTYLQTSTKREATIMESLDEIVIVTNQSLSILSVNEATEKILKTDEAALQNKIFLDAISLTDEQGKVVDRQGLLIDNILRDKSSRIIDGFMLTFPDKTRASKVRIQVRPVVDPSGDIAQLIFVITEVTMGEGSAIHSDLLLAEEKTSRLEVELESTLKTKNLLNDQLKFQAFNLNNNDLRLAQDLEDHPIQKNNQIESLAFITSQAIKSLQTFADDLKVPLAVNLPEQDTAMEKSYQELKTAQETQSDISSSVFALAIDKHWFFLFIKYMTRLHLMLTPDPAFGISINISRSESQIRIEWLSHPSGYSGTKNTALLEQYYPGVEPSNNSSLMSGLEGFIMASIAKQMGIPIETEFIKSAGILKMTATINRTFSS